MLNDTRLIMFEGLPGTGKSTNSYFSYVQLEQNEKTVTWIHEVAHPHPLMLEYDNWATPLDKYIIIALNKCIDFIKGIQEDSEMYIINSGIFQCHIFNFLLKNAPYGELKMFIDKLINIMEPLNPSLVYFYRDNTEDTISFLENQRGIQSLEGIWERDKSQPYYSDKPKGAEGFKQFLRDYGDIAKRLYNDVDCRKISIEITNQAWNTYEESILSFIGIERKSYLNASPPSGIFRNETLNIEIEVKGLSITDPEGIKRVLAPKTDCDYYVECLPVILSFKGLDKIFISGGQIIAEWTTFGTQFIRVK